MRKRLKLSILISILCFTLFSFEVHASGGGGHGGINWVFAGSLIFNFLLFVGILYMLLKRKVADFFVDRSKEIAEQLDKAEKARKKAEDTLVEYKTKIEELVTTREEIIEKTKAEAEYEKDKIIRQAKAQAANILEDVDRTVSIEVEAIKRDVYTEASKKIALEAEKILVEASSDDDTIRLTDDYIDSLREVKRA